MTGACVTVVTVTYNAASLVSACLDGLAGQRLDGLQMDVVVVDNGSTDRTADLVQAAYPDVRLIRSPINHGFAGGNNLALRGLDSPWVILLNNDAVPRPDFVQALVRAMQVADEDVAGMAATVLLADRFRAAEPGDAQSVEGADGTWARDRAGTVRLVNSTGNTVRTDGFGVDRGWLANAATHHPPADVFGFSGAAAILRVSALADVGLFDERFFMYYEDTDLSWRLRLAGYRFEHCVGAVVDHVHAASSSEGSAFFRFHDQRNRLATLTKNASARLLLEALARYCVTTVSVGIRRRRGTEVALRARVLASYLRMLPHLVRERRAIAEAARVSRRDVERLLAPVTGASPGSYRT